MIATRLVLEFCSGGTLGEYMKRKYNPNQKKGLDETEAKDIMQQLGNNPIIVCKIDEECSKGTPISSL